jgi:hypothetical protein
VIILATKLRNYLDFLSLISNFVGDMKISLDTKRFGKTITNRTINIILAIVAGILGVLCIMSITRY